MTLKDDDVDLERGSSPLPSREYKAIDVEEDADTEQHALLKDERGAGSGSGVVDRLGSPPPKQSNRKFATWHLVAAFIAGLAASFIAQLALQSFCLPPLIHSTGSSSTTNNPADLAQQVAPSSVGSSEQHNFPPASPTNAFTSLFPPHVGYAGPTPTGAEPALIATAPSYPVNTEAPQLVRPPSLRPSDSDHKGKGKGKGKGKKNKDFDLFKSWGNLSPWYSVPRGAFGLDSSPDPPEGCAITGLHFLHRHGARYPTQWSAYGGPAKFASKLHKNAHKWDATDDLDFLNSWTYKLGEEVLTPFGRQQLFDLGVSLRLKYGFLLKNFTESNTLPVFRTESQDRMLNSALNFAAGFFGIPYEHQYLQSITIEEEGFNNTLAPYKTCPNAKIPRKADRGTIFLKEWVAIYLKDAHERLAPQLKGVELTIEDTYILQQLCAYETVAIGYSKFCALFTEEEWEGFEYAMDIYFWYGSAFGSPVARVQGLGYIHELVSRLTHTPIETHNSSTNSTLNDNKVTFPLDQSLYVDATHEVVVLNVITALNLSNFAANGPLPTDHIPENRTFITSQLSPFATNMQFQLLSCPTLPTPQIRIIINDGVTPLTGIKGCPDQKDGMCDVETFVEAQKEIIGKTDWRYDCHGDWEVPEGWWTVTGDSPK